MTEPVVCYFDSIQGRNEWGLWFYNPTEHAAATVGSGHLLWTPVEEGVITQPALVLNGRWEAPALKQALANTPTTDVWKARYEELSRAIERAEGRVDKVLGRFLGD